LPSGKRGWTETARQTLDAWARPLADGELDEAWRGLLHLELQRLDALRGLLAELDAKLDAVADDDDRVALLRSIPGVGRRTAEVIVATLDDPQRFGSRRQVAAYAGLIPRRYQSGAMDRSGRISKRGNTLLRQVLNQASWAAIRYDPHLRAVFMRVSDGGRKGRRKLAIVAVMHKLLVIAWAMLRDGRRYQPRPEPTLQVA
jgi:transposase